MTFRPAEVVEPGGAGEAEVGAALGAALGSALGSVGTAEFDPFSMDVVFARPEGAEVRKAVC